MIGVRVTTSSSPCVRFFAVFLKPSFCRVAEPRERVRGTNMTEVATRPQSGAPVSYNPNVTRLTRRPTSPAAAHSCGAQLPRAATVSG